MAALATADESGSPASFRPTAPIECIKGRAAAAVEPGPCSSFPLNVDVAMTRWPIANWVLIGVICCASVLGWLCEPFFLALAGLSRNPVPVPPPLEGPVDLREAAERSILRALLEGSLGPPVFRPPQWTLPVLAVTSTLLHADVIHLAGNMLFLWVFGNAVNYKFGHVRFLGLYFGAALLSGRVCDWWSMPGTAVVGASGAIMGIVGAYLVFFPRNDVVVFYCFVLFGLICPHVDTFRMSSWIMIAA